MRPSFGNLNDIILGYFGILTYPEEIIYYSASVCENRKEELSAVKNLKINEKGFIVNKDSSTRQQKGVDGYIISDLTDLSYEDTGIIALMSGDGDMKAGVEKIFVRKNKRVQIIGLENSISKELSEFCDFHYLDEDLKLSSDIISESITPAIPQQEKVETTDYDRETFEKIKEIIEHLRKVDKNNVTMSAIGQNAKKFNFKYPKRKLAKILSELENAGMIKLKKKPDEQDHFVELS